MKSEELEHILARESDIEPSSGFVAAVMDAVVAEATAPPLPFPWKRAWPFAAGFLVLLLWLAFRSHAAPPGPDLYAWFKTIVPMATSWVLGALVTTLALTVWSLRLSVRGVRL